MPMRIIDANPILVDYLIVIACFLSVLLQTEGENQRIFPAIGRRIIMLARTDFIKPELGVERERRPVGGPDLEQQDIDIMPAGDLHKVFHQLLADTTAPGFGLHCQVENVRFLRGDTHHTIAEDFSCVFIGPATVTHTQTVTENSRRPGEVIGALFNRHHRIKVIQ